jgi:hypothetical protein
MVYLAYLHNILRYRQSPPPITLCIFSLIALDKRETAGYIMLDVMLYKTHTKLHITVNQKTSLSWVFNQRIQHIADTNYTFSSKVSANNADMCTIMYIANSVAD